MAAFKSPFEKLSIENQQIMATQLSPGGELFGLFEEIRDQLQNTEKRIQKDEAKTKVSLFAGLTMKEAAAWQMMGEKGLQAIAKGFGAIAKVIDAMETSGEEAQQKMEAIAAGLESIKGLGRAIFELAGYLLLATPLLMIGVLAAPLFAISIFVIAKALQFATKFITERQ